MADDQGRATRSILRVLARLLLALVVLNALLTVHSSWPGLGVRFEPELSLDLAVILLGTAAIGAGWTSRPAVRTGLTVLLVALVLGRYLDVATLVLLGREIKLYWELQHLPSVVAMFWAATPKPQLAAIFLATLACLALLTLAIRWSVGTLAGAMARPSLRAFAGAGGALAIIVFALGAATEQNVVTRWFSRPITPVFLRQAAFAVARPALPVGNERLAHTRLRPEALCGADLLTLFIESYGVIVFDDARIAAPLQGRFDELARAVQQRGFGAASARVESPTFGGSSWLAHASLLTGVPVTDQWGYDRLLATSPRSLPSAVRGIGYRSVALFPGLKGAWPEGQAYGFDIVYDASALGYDGPAYGWWGIPDQYSLETFYRRELAPAERRPVFLAGATIMSHLPFHPVPPYLPDWPAAGRAYPPPHAAASADLVEAYTASVSYALDVLRGFVAERAPANVLIILLGDHQPLAAVSGAKASRAVPVHAIASRPQVLAALLSAGFVEGLRPGTVASGRISDLHDRIVDLLAGSPDCGP